MSNHDPHGHAPHGHAAAHEPAHEPPPAAVGQEYPKALYKAKALATDPLEFDMIEVANADEERQKKGEGYVEAADRPVAPPTPAA